jgi:hypothetical protein
MIYFSSWWQTNIQWFLVFPKQIHFRNNKPESTVNTRIIPLCLTQDTIAPQLQINMCPLNNERCFTYSHLHGTILHWILEDLVVLWWGLGRLFSKYVQAYTIFTVWSGGLMLQKFKVSTMSHVTFTQ